MRKFLKSVLLAVSIIAIAGSAVSAQTDQADIRVQVDGQLIEFTDAKPFIDAKTGRTLVPLRFVGEHLGVTFDWNESAKIVHMKLDSYDYEIDLPIGATRLDVGSNTFRFESPATIIDDRTYVPLRFVSEVFGAKVSWNGEERIVNILPNQLPPPSSTSKPRHLETEPAVIAFVESVKVEGNKVTGTIPQIPDGYRYTLNYRDRSNGDMGDRTKDLLYLDQKYKPGDTFSFTFDGAGGVVEFNIAIGNKPYNGAGVQIPTLTIWWGTVR